MGETTRQKREIVRERGKEGKKKGDGGTDFRFRSRHTSGGHDHSVRASLFKVRGGKTVVSGNSLKLIDGTFIENLKNTWLCS